jgi:hypothetical protein
MRDVIQGLLARKAGLIDQFVAPLLSLMLSVGHRLHDTDVTSGEQTDDGSDCMHIASSLTSIRKRRHTHGSRVPQSQKRA